MRWLQEKSCQVRAFCGSGSLRLPPCSLHPIANEVLYLHFRPKLVSHLADSVLSPFSLSDLGPCLVMLAPACLFCTVHECPVEAIQFIRVGLVGSQGVFRSLSTSKEVSIKGIVGAMGEEDDDSIKQRLK